MAHPPISALPPEILTIIFKYVHTEYLNTHDLTATQSPVTGDHDVFSIEKIRDLAKEPTFFPYSVASVCPFWEETLSAIPEFWTRLVIFLDKQYTEIENVKKYLSWSRDLLFDIFMTRRAELRPDPLLAEHLERNRVLHNMRYIMPHFHRCRILHVDVGMNSSLPVLPSRLPCETPFLRSISFESDLGLTVWDKHGQKLLASLVDADLPILDSSEGGSTFAFQPKLKSFSIDGRNLQRAIAEEKPWIVEQDDLEDLSIFQYDPVAMSRKIFTYHDDFHIHTCNECCLNLYQTLRMCQSFGSLLNLRFDTVQFDISPSDVGEDTFDFSQLNSLTLEKMAPEIIQEIFRVCEFEVIEDLGTLVFIHCPRLHQVELPPLATSEIYLLGLETDVDLQPILKDWRGEFLSISCCSSFSDAFLQKLATREGLGSADDGNDGVPETMFFCNRMTALDLHFLEFPPFSARAVRNMVEARNYNVDYTAQDWGENMIFGPAIKNLSVRGEVPQLSQDEEEWFRSRLVHFSWGEG